MILTRNDEYPNSSLNSLWTLFIEMNCAFVNWRTFYDK